MVPLSIEKHPGGVREPQASTTETTTAAQLAQLNSTLDQVAGALIDIREVLKQLDVRLNSLPKALADLQKK